MRTETNEQKLLEGLAINDRKAVEAIYKQHFSMVQSLVTANSGGSDDARDIFQEAMIVLYEKVKTGTFELNCQIKTYLYSVCRRLWFRKTPGPFRRWESCYPTWSETRFNPCCYPRPRVGNYKPTHS